METEPDVELIPEEVLLDTASFPSALQVFASVGGLALLAEHLPLLYPEVTRQVSPPDLGRDLGNPGAIGHDWVTVESSEDIYEVHELFLYLFLKLIQDITRVLNALSMFFIINIKINMKYN